MVQSVLIIEDDAEIRAIIEECVEDAGFSVYSASRGLEGLSLARALRPPVVLLDVRLPDVSGIEVCKRLREDPGTAGSYLILVSGLTDERDRVAGFEAGADDYVSKPFSLRELALRVRAGARRVDQEPESSDSSVVRIDDEAHRVWVGDEELTLTLTEYRLLSYLASHPGRLCSRAELLQRVWDLPPHLNTRTVDTHVRRLRTKLRGASGCIETVHGAGYRFAHGLGSATPDGL